MSKPLAILYYSNLMPGGHLVNRMQDLGYRVQTIPDISQLGEVCQIEKPLVVVAEIIPGGPSISSIRQLRTDPATGHIPVLGYSTNPDATQNTQATEAGVTLLAGTTAISEHLPRLLEQVLQLE